MTQKKIIFPLDFSELSLIPLSFASYLAAHFKAELVLLHVLELPSAPARLFYSVDETEVRAKADKEMDSIILSHAREGVTFSKMFKFGKPHAAIVEAAKEIGAIYVIMGTHGASGIQEYLIGSNASRVIREAPCPVISFRNTPGENAFRHILLPLDLTKETREKIAFALEFAQIFESEITVMSVLQTTDAEIQNRLKLQLEKVEEYLKSKEMKVNSALLISTDNIADVVVEYSKQINADLIAIMTQQELKLKEQFLGSTAEHIVNNAQVPVVSIRPTRTYRSESVTWRFND
jgi:nucleotide-binding universal stress UspA family protein